MIAIVKYNSGNVKSVYNAVTRLGYEAVITDDFETLQNADKVIFPGVGEASSAMAYLKEKGLDEVIKNLKQPTKRHGITSVFMAVLPETKSSTSARTARKPSKTHWQK